MAAETDGAPGFEFRPGKTYEPAMVARQVIWPLVAYIWDGQDWLEKSEAGYELKYPKEGEYERRIIRVQVEADCIEWTESGSDAKPNIARSVTLSIEEAVPLDVKTITLEAARVARLRRTRNDGKAWADGDEINLRVSTGLAYWFDEDGTYSPQVYTAIKAPDQDPIHVPIDDNEVIENVIRPYDIKSMRIACHILNAPAEIMQALGAIEGAD